MKRFKVIKIVYAKDFATALLKEKKFQPVEVSLDEAVEPPKRMVKVDLIGEEVIGYRYEEDEDPDGRE
jgi:hypothetical protein